MRRLVIVAIFIVELMTTADLAASDRGVNQLAVVAPFLNEQTIAVVGIDLSRIDFTRLKDASIDPLNRDDATVHRPTATIAQFQKWTDQFTRDGGGRVFIITTLTNLPDFPAWRAGAETIVRSTFFVVPDAKIEAIDQLREAIAEMKPSIPLGETLIVSEIKGTTVVGTSKLLEKLATMQPSPRQELEQAFKAVGNRSVWLAVIPPPVFARAAEEILREPLAGKDRPLGLVLARGFLWAALAIEPNPNRFSAHLVIQSADESAATELGDLLGRATKQIGNMLAASDKDAPTNREAIWQSLAPKVDGDRLVLSLDDELAPVAKMFAQKTYTLVTEELFRNESMNKLKQIELALHNYHDKHKQFPPAIIRDQEGKPLLSWRVAILPYLDGAKLYREFRLDEPWDSANNRKLIERMPDSFHSPDTGYGHPGRTRYLAAVGENLAFPPDRGVTIQDFTDGTSKTIMVVEADADHAVIWTKPEDMEIDLEQPTRGLLAPVGKLFNAARADGSVTSYSGAIDADVLRALFTRNGGEIIDEAKVQSK